MLSGFLQRKSENTGDVQVKESSTVLASHVNTGTRSEDIIDGPYERIRGRAFRHRKLTGAVEETDSTVHGGLSLAVSLSATLKIPQRVDASLKLLTSHRPFHESDHVLTHVYNLFLGGECIEDIAELQVSSPLRRILGTDRVPDPTTSGDFLRRFEEQDVRKLDAVCDELHLEVWRRAYGRKKRELLTVDIDSHVHAIYGNQKEKADFTYKGTYGFHPLVVSVAETHECLRLINRSGNVPSAEGSEKVFEELFPKLLKRTKKVLIRGDSAFAAQKLYDVCEQHGQYFAFTSGQQRNFEMLGDTIPERSWKVFHSAPEKKVPPCRRKRGRNLRQEMARQRGKLDLQLKRQWVAEIPYQPARSSTVYRLIVRRQKIEESLQGELFERWRYRYVITNLPSSYRADAVMRLTYKRCDQENVIEQLQHGIAAMRMPTGNFTANAAYLTCARIAHNFKAWLTLLALPREALRWHWKRFRRAFVTVGARITMSARQILVRFSTQHRFSATILQALNKLQN